MKKILLAVPVVILCFVFLSAICLSESNDKYTIEFDGNGATNVETYFQNIAYGKEKTLKKNRYKLKGYVFSCWDTESDGSGDHYDDGQKVKDLTDGDAVILYAQWDIKGYTITYHLGGGKNSHENPESYTIDDEIVIKEPQRDGYVFDGWYTDSEMREPFDGIIADRTGNIDLYAKWRAEKFTYVFHGNGADDDKTYTQTGKCGSKKRLTANRFKRKGYTFTEWNTEPDGSGTAVKDKAKFSKCAGNDGDMIDLYAQWRPVMTTLIFNGVEFTVVNTKKDIVSLSEQTEGKICTLAGHPGRCLAFSYYYAHCLVNGVTDPNVKDGSRGYKEGLSIREVRSTKPKYILKDMYDHLKKGMPQILMVKATNHKDRHFLLVVGYKSSLTNRNDIKATDLLVIDTHDGKLESMDPEIFPENTRLMHKQNGFYRYERVE